MANRRWIIVSNRLPFMRDPQGDGYVRSSGGLVTAINGIQSDAERIWCGIAPDCVTPEEWANISGLPEAEMFKPVFIPPQQYEAYYNGFSNGALWPLFHYESNFVKAEISDWEAYQEVNRQIARSVAEIARDDDLVWVHDFHLFLVPQMLRELQPNVAIGFFLHIPFPSSEVARQLPMRSQIIEGLLGADLIGFHDFSYLRHFSSTLELMEGIIGEPFRIRYNDRIVSLGVFPVSIDTQSFYDSARSDEIVQLTKNFKQTNPYEITVLGVDRLDYTKGVDLKIQAFELFLEKYPDFRDKVRLLQIAVPTREKVENYQELRVSIEQAVGRINGKFGSINEAPVRYVYSTVPQNELLALYRMADVLLVTSKRDGMNLVCQEYIACQDENDPGVVVLSEFAGAISNLSHVIAVNPWDFHSVADSLATALRMPLEERQRRHSSMLSYLQGYTATAWAEFFMNELLGCAESRETGYGEVAPLAIGTEDVAEWKPRLEGRDLYLFLDFDGTLTAIESTPDQVRLPAAIADLIKGLVRCKNTFVTIISGRPAHYLERECASTGATLAAEHGGEFYDPETGQWTSLVRSDLESWYERADKLLKMYASYVPGSFIERKKYSLAWHYRLSPRHFGAFQARRLAFELRSMFKDLPVAVLSGNKVIEVKSFEAGKGLFCRWFLTKNNGDDANRAIMAVGDDTTDEEMFHALPDSMTIKIGPGPSRAAYRLASQLDVAKLLRTLLEIRK
ncbi:MAG: bifunctional alpha,alpha-trehalose-phosphate synthase (UDP-forming)/trehalose-phosphatase [Deltaproteobacteria bacterium]|nr:bifunctional alpha,alpha-trehalose-phosphate synthase (UDP-forming)/trehalose-phosphatase [Deltaproteobacteria bacterium]